MPREWRQRIEDIVQCVRRIDAYISGMTQTAFEADEKTQDAVLRNLELVGEAARHIPKEIELRYSAVPWGEMRAQRNLLIHTYHRVDLSLVWTTITTDLPPLLQSLEAMLADEPSN
jgi:uncharacterized protein with HEPN domain